MSAYRRNDVSAWPEHEHLVYAETPKLRYADTFVIGVPLQFHASQMGIVVGQSNRQFLR